MFSGFYYLKTGPVFIRFLFQPNKNRGASAASYGYLACLRVHAQVHTGLSTAYSLLRWPPPGGLPQRPKVLSSGGSGVSEQAFRLRSFVRASPGTGLRATAARFY